MNNHDQFSCSCDKCVEKSKFISISKLIEIDECLNKLTELDLSSNNICQVPDLIGNLVNIVILNLSLNNLTTLPQNFENFQHLTNLNLSYNKFSLLPQSLITGMHSIVSLDLSYNQLSDISMKPHCIQQLMLLNVSYNLQLKSLPQWLWSLECSLESLDVSGTNCLNNIEDDPYLNMYGISNNLKYLNVSNTNADVLKLDFIKHLKNLKKIDLNNKSEISNKYRNFFDDVPLVFNYRFKFINSLNMANVSLSCFGKNVYFSLPNVRFLDLSNNLIVILPKTFSELINLEVCDLSNNQLLSIPECIKSLKKLKKLVLNNNWLIEFPNILEDLSNLEFLDLYTNKIAMCPSWNSKFNIKSLDLEQNLFSTENSIDQNDKDDVSDPLHVPSSGSHGEDTEDGTCNENYLKLLKNLRLSINDSRITGSCYVEECINSDSSFNDDKSSYSSYSEHSYNEENQDVDYIVEEQWDSNFYEHITDLFDPKEFETILMNELMTFKKQISLDDIIKEDKLYKNANSLADKHYFRPSDQLPKLISMTKTIEK